MAACYANNAHLSANILARVLHALLQCQVPPWRCAAGPRCSPRLLSS
jgi:hypothetical protein